MNNSPRMNRSLQVCEGVDAQLINVVSFLGNNLALTVFILGWLRLPTWRKWLPWLRSLTRKLYLAHYPDGILTPPAITLDITQSLSLPRLIMTSAESAHEGPPNKRRKLDSDVIDTQCTPPTSEEAIPGEATATSLQRPISPPPLRSRQRTPRSPTPHASQRHLQVDVHVTEPSPAPAGEAAEALCKATAEQEPDRTKSNFFRSPFQLTRIRDLAPRQNEDAVRLRDILGHGMIRECWNFNYLFDLDFFM